MDQFFSKGTNLSEEEIGKAILRKAKAPPLVARNLLATMRGVTKLVRKEFDDATIADMERVVNLHPEGTLRYLLGMMYFAREKYAKAEPILLQAAVDPAVSVIRPSALLGALACEIMMVSPQWTNFPDPEVLKRLGANVRTLYRPGMIRQTFEAELMANAASRTKQYDLARAILADWEKLDPKDPALHRRRTNVSLFAGDFTGAVEAAAKAPNDPEVQIMRRQALEQIDLFLKRQPK